MLLSSKFEAEVYIISYQSVNVVDVVLYTGENGILLNQDAIHILVENTIEKIKELSIRQAQSYMYVDEKSVVFNDSKKMMRIKRDVSQIVEQKDGDYAVYYYAN